ncbi:hypothetical protein BpHYR1_021257 [Brachionus plicatilis]|uniref:Uncharacterized protein n=1 Tax=Brachionus plicatilis TaxID=10195 RepID=A0A3M7P1Z0_BRAPC|nr:hypothetical protein BpHYR1_021257 [Brachionus plicatilis]
MTLKPNRSQSACNRPVVHEPCSSTLGKFHDGVNYSLVNENTSRRGSNTPRSNHPVLEAKQKYKYMVTKKSFIDESLFGNTTPRYSYQNYGDMFQKEPDIFQFSKNHLTHDLMSNLTPLQIHAPMPSSRRNLDSARTISARSRVDIELKENINCIKSKPPIKPWRP